MSNFSFLESFTIGRKKRASISIADDLSTNPFSFLLSPIKAKQQFGSRSKIKETVNIQLQPNNRYEEIKSNISSSIKNKIHSPIKACTIDFAGTRF